MYTSPEEIRGAIVREAFEWISTPYGNCGDIKGPNGCVDCAMLLIRVFANAGAIEYFDPRPYNSNWHLHQDEARYMAGLEKYAHRVDEGLLGDIAMYRFGKHASHGAIIVSDDLIIHAHKRDGQVIQCERSSMLSRLDSYWSVIH
jgi:cell wall-associated NlpC family hydrolase